jgi:prephenate dehydratase
MQFTEPIHPEAVSEIVETARIHLLMAALETAVQTAVSEMVQMVGSEIMERTAMEVSDKGIQTGAIEINNSQEGSVIQVLSLDQIIILSLPIITITTAVSDPMTAAASDQAEVLQVALEAVALQAVV